MSYLNEHAVRSLGVCCGYLLMAATIYYYYLWSIGKAGKAWMMFYVGAIVCCFQAFL
jgi:hypothetical protein